MNIFFTLMEVNLYHIKRHRIGRFENLLVSVTVANYLVKFLIKPSIIVDGTVTNKSTLKWKLSKYRY